MDKLCPSSGTVDDAIMVTVNRALALFPTSQHRSGRWRAGLEAACFALPKATLRPLPSVGGAVWVRHMILWAVPDRCGR